MHRRRAGEDPRRGVELKLLELVVGRPDVHPLVVGRILVVDRRAVNLVAAIVRADLKLLKRSVWRDRSATKIVGVEQEDLAFFAASHDGATSGDQQPTGRAKIDV